MSLFTRLKHRLMLIPNTREPDFIIGNPRDPYLRRWWVIPRNRFFNIYLHHFRRSDDDRALHDHPYLFNCSLLLDGMYREWVRWEDRPKGAEVATSTDSAICGIDRYEGAYAWRWGAAPHRIELPNGGCWTLFITGPRVREWGFLCPNGWIPWHVFTKSDRPGEIGKGCD